MTTTLTTARDRVAEACDVMTEAGGPVLVSELAARLHCSTRQLQRDFAEVLSITPRQFGQALRTDRTKEALRSSSSVLDAAFAAGYGSVRGFYEEAARRLGMTPAEYLAGAPEQVMVWSLARTDVGDVIAVATPRGLAAVRTLQRDDHAMSDVMAALSALCAGDRAPELPVDVHGTAFQARVWSALREIPSGQTRTYTEVAAAIGKPTSVRAVARACATNPVALAIPCHRVIRSDGSLAGYRWGLAVKQSLLASEHR
jgi:AraC family transcriptional regulator of adaptative response/methylated-DNA-[protein]-cysteine methyltransferase